MNGNAWNAADNPPTTLMAHTSRSRKRRRQGTFPLCCQPVLRLIIPDSLQQDTGAAHVPGHRDEQRQRDWSSSGAGRGVPTLETLLLVWVQQGSQEKRCRVIGGWQNMDTTETGVSVVSMCYPKLCFTLSCCNQPYRLCTSRYNVYVESVLFACRCGWWTFVCICPFGMWTNPFLSL